MVVFVQSGCIRESGSIRAKMVVFGQKWMYSCKVFVILQSRCIREKWLYAGKNVVIGQSGCIRGKLVVFG